MGAPGVARDAVNTAALEFGNDPPDMNKALKKQKKKRERIEGLHGRPRSYLILHLDIAPGGHKNWALGSSQGGGLEKSGLGLILANFRYMSMEMI